ncbi:MAG: hypothetical protein F9K49_01015 [Caedimonadaceae bacterium]|nr:MAG: hypothetical protein F9K49_01015 [Caedimonadaceae bacterium]
MKQNILKLTTAAFVGLFATSAQATWTAEEYEALFEAKPSLLKKLADEIVDSGGSDAFEAQLGAGGLDVVKARIGVPGNTGVDVDLDAQIARIEGGNPTLKVAIDDTKALINSGVANNTLMQDIQAEIGIANGASGGADADLHAAVATLAGGFAPIAQATIDTINVGSVGLAAAVVAAAGKIGAGVTIPLAITDAKTQVGVGGGGTIAADVDAQRDRVRGGQADLKVAIDTTKTLLGYAGATTLYADIDGARGALNAASASAAADLENAVVDMVAAVPGAGVLAKVQAGTSLATLDARLDAQKLRISNVPAISIDAGLTAVEVLVPHANGVVQDITAVKATIDAGANVTVANAVAAAAHKIDAAAADIPAGIVAAVAKINAGSADIPAAIAAAAPKIDAGGATTIPAAIAAAAAKLYGFTSTGGGAFVNTTTVAYAGAAGDLPALITYFIN